MTNKQSVVFARFLRGAVAGAVSTMIVILPVGIGNFNDLTPWLTSLALSGIVGFITGGLQAIDKAFRYEDEAPEEGA